MEIYLSALKSLKNIASFFSPSGIAPIWGINALSQPPKTSKVALSQKMALTTHAYIILLVPWLHIVKTVYKRIFACKLTNNICVIILVRCCGPHLLFATRLHTSCLGWCRSVRRKTHHVTPRRTRVWRVRRWTTPSHY